MLKYKYNFTIPFYFLGLMTTLLISCTESFTIENQDFESALVIVQPLVAIQNPIFELIKNTNK